MAAMTTATPNYWDEIRSLRNLVNMQQDLIDDLSERVSRIEGSIKSSTRKEG